MDLHINADDDAEKAEPHESKRTENDIRDPPTKAITPEITSGVNDDDIAKAENIMPTTADTDTNQDKVIAASLERLASNTLQLRGTRRGIGVFPIIPVKKNTVMWLPSLPSVSIDPRVMESIPAPIREAVQRSLAGKTLALPTSGLSIVAIGSYLQHSNTPSATLKGEFIRFNVDISIGQEVTIDYKTCGENRSITMTRQKKPRKT
jgi:hypothetical protein